MKFTACLVNYNTPPEIFNPLISSLFQSKDVVKVSVIFNGPLKVKWSSDLITLFNSNKLEVTTSENKGFGCANNQLVSHADTEGIILLNPDLAFDFSAIDRLTHFFHKSSLDLMGPILIDKLGSIYPSLRKLPRFSNHISRFLGKDSSSYIISFNFRNSVCYGEFLSGAFWITTKNIFCKVGGFDEKYFLYMEDIDFCRRLKKLGYSVGVTNVAQVTHFHGDGPRKSLKLMFIFFISLFRYYFKDASI
jgi:GT2 family glycosyltransferase